MTESTDTPPSSAADTDRLPATAVLLLAALAGPIVWVLQFSTHYGMTPFLCEHGGGFALHLSTVLALAVTGLALAVCMVIKRRLAGRLDDRVRQRAHSIASAGLYANAFFLAVIVATALPPFFIDPCVH